MVSGLLPRTGEYRRAGEYIVRGRLGPRLGIPQRRVVDTL